MTNIFIFMAGDNNLDSDSMLELDSILSSNINEKYRILIELDRYKSYNRNEIDKRITRRYVKDAYEIKEQKLGETNTGSHIVLKEFIKWGSDLYPSEKTYIILWGHGYGWLGCAEDYGNNDILSLSELKMALSDILIPNKVLLGFDMCLMGTIEVLTSLHKLTKYVIVSQNIEPSEGWFYKEFLEAELFGTKLFAQKILDTYSQNTSNQDTYTLSLINTHQTEELITSFELLSQYLLKNTSLLNNLIHIRNSCVSFKDEYIDFLNFIINLSKSAPSTHIKELCKKTQFLFSQLIINNVSGKKYEKVNGLSIYFPKDKISYSILSEYSKIDFALKCPSWVKILENILIDKTIQ